MKVKEMPHIASMSPGLKCCFNKVMSKINTYINKVSLLWDKLGFDFKQSQQSHLSTEFSGGDWKCSNPVTSEHKWLITLENLNYHVFLVIGIMQWNHQLHSKRCIIANLMCCVFLWLSTCIKKCRYSSKI